MTYDDVAPFLQQLTFLASVGAASALIFSLLMKDKWLAVFVASGIATVGLTFWMFFESGRFDIPLLMQTVVVSTGTALPIVSIVQSMRGLRGQSA